MSWITPADAWAEVHLLFAEGGDPVEVSDILLGGVESAGVRMFLAQCPPGFSCDYERKSGRITERKEGPARRPG
jgi:hypothetical protein